MYTHEEESYKEVPWYGTMGVKKKEPETDLLLYQNINFGNGNETVETTSKVEKLHLYIILIFL